MKTPERNYYNSRRKILVKAIEDARFVVAEKEEQLRIARNVLYSAEEQLRAFERR